MLENIYNGSLFFRRLTYRLILLTLGFNLWMDQLLNIFIGWVRSGSEAISSGLGAVTENWFWKNTLGTVTETDLGASSMNFMWWTITIFSITASVILWWNALKAIIFVSIDYKKTDKKNHHKAFIVFAIVANIVIYILLNTNIYNMWS